MVKEISLLDKIHLQKYTFLLTLFISENINVSKFENLFLKIRREDSYLFSGLFNIEIQKVLDALFLDVDEYTPDELFDPNSKFNIGEEELRIRAKEALKKLNELIKH